MNPWLCNLLFNNSGGVSLPTTGQTFYASLKNSLVPEVGTGGPTWSRATAAWRFNDIGLLRQIPSGCAEFGGARLVVNTVRTKSEDFSNAAWTKANCTTPSATVVVCANATGPHSISQLSSALPIIAGQTYLYAIEAAKVAGGIDFIQLIPNFNGFSTGKFSTFSLINGTFAATGCEAGSILVSPGRYIFWIKPVATASHATGESLALALANSISDGRLPNFVGDGIKSVTLLRAWSVDVTGRDAAYVPEYVSVGVLSAPYHGAGEDGCKYFTTDSQGAPIPVANLTRLRKESAATNGLLYSRDLSKNAWGGPASSGVGSELLTNGSFAVSTDWVRSGAAYWSVSDGVLNLNATDSSSSYYDNSQPYAALVTGKQYIVEFDYVHTSGAAPTITLRGGDAKAIGNSTGRKTVTVTCGASVAGYGIRIGTFAPAVATIDNITIKEAPVQCALTATGLDGIANTATTLTATATDAIILQPITLASAARCASTYVKRVTGTGTISFTQDGGSTWTDITSQFNSATFSRVQITATLANPSVGFKISTSGDAIAVDCVQNEAGSVATSPIVTTTATVARNTDAVNYPTSGNIDFTSGTCYALLKSSGSLITRFGVSVGADGYSYINSAGANTSWGSYDGTNILVKTGLDDMTAGPMVKRAVAWGGSTQKVTGNGATPVSGAFDGSWGSGATINIASTLLGNIGDIAIYNYKMTDAELQAITT